MGHNHSHSHGSCGHHHHGHESNLFFAIILNVGLTVAQIIGGIVSGSFSLIADALHNLSDAGSLVIAYLAQKISGQKANDRMNFGYARAQIIGALINSVSLAFIGIYLLIEASKKFLDPQPIDGWIVVIVAGIALVIDIGTAMLTFKGSKNNINMKAAFIHNMSDAMASVAVIISGILIILYKIYWVDFIATFIISLYVLWHSWGLTKDCIKTLMQAVPDDLNILDVTEALSKIENVIDVHQVRIWSLDDNSRVCEAHIKINNQDLKTAEGVKVIAKKILSEKFKISHSTLEFEHSLSDCK